MFRLSGAFLFVAVAGTSCARAQPATADSSYSLPGITIEDDRAPFYGNGTAAFVTRLRDSDLKKSGASTVASALRRFGAVFVRQYGPNGSAGVTLRGTGTSQMAVLLDGLPIEDPQLGQIDLSLLPTAMLSGAEVFHGGASSLVGGGAVGGVISLQSLNANAGERVQLSTSMGAWGERALAGRMVIGMGRVRGVVAGEASRLQGDFPYQDRNHLPEVRRVRENADGSARSLMGRIVFAGDRSTTEVAGWITNADRGLPGLAGSSTGSERQKDRIARLWVRYASGGTVIWTAAQRSRLTYLNPELGVDDTSHTSSMSVGVTQRQDLGPSVRSDFGIEVSAQSADHPAIGDRARQTSLKAFFVGTFSAGRLSVLPSVRGDWVSRGEQSTGKFSPAIRLRMDRVLPGSIAVMSGLSTSFRAPTFNDLFWRGQGAMGNRYLVAEKGLSADLGVEFLNSDLVLQVSGFYQLVRDQIVWMPNVTGLWTPENVGRVRSAGLEGSVTASIATTRSFSADVRLHYTLTDSRDRSDRSAPSYDKPLRHVPRQVLSLNVSSGWKWLGLGFGLRHADRRYITSDATEWLGAHTVIEAVFSSRFDSDVGSVDLRLFVENVGGTQYEIMPGYPMPPRHARLQLTLTMK